MEYVKIRGAHDAWAHFSTIDKVTKKVEKSMANERAMEDVFSFCIPIFPINILWLFIAIHCWQKTKYWKMKLETKRINLDQQSG
ncbi:hypothetical protein A3715_17025 [Oleiphilus sp. HI0009]|nr:hypothetical protein A3715_17025 [Oleiphilus sp. HI0009]